MPEVIFQVKCPTQIGENVRLVGSTKTLGTWTPSLAVRLQTTSDTYPIWKSNAIVLLEPDIEYKYVVVKEIADKVHSRMGHQGGRTVPIAISHSLFAVQSHPLVSSSSNLNTALVMPEFRKSTLLTIHLKIPRTS
jgi:hypothetical protein